MTDKTLEIQEQDVETTETTQGTFPRRLYIPRVDIYENDDAVFLAVDLPGVPEDAVDLTLEKNILTIHGAIDDIQPDDHELTYREYRVGDYKRTFALSDEVDRDRIEATMKNGVLNVTLSKVEEAKSRTIEVRTA
ncbi:MAG TPA: Hsp20/alpha crystallin family protein [candidate division Zixibacteria bacterium]|jgi:HSP20 family molecular chaperone IbpA|nr:Hsp20/alpha crystallin family protein [candidate division Zixibacteria bacterium]